MPGHLTISLSPERLDEGDPEERAGFGLFAVQADAAFLTEGFDHYINAYRTGPLVSGYHAAEWFVWNWWRLCHEPRTSADEWWRAHNMTAVGEGYVWPNLTIFSDGLRTRLQVIKSTNPNAQPFRYFGATPVVVPTIEFEQAVQEFVTQILGRLREEAIDSPTNLDLLWRDLVEERKDPERSRFRQIEALLGEDPDELDPAMIERLMEASESLGKGAVEEIAAEGGISRDRRLPEFGDLRDLALEMGCAAAPQEAIRLARGSRVPRGPDRPAWQVGTAAAKAVRKQAALHGQPLSNKRLAEMAATSPDVVERSPNDVPIAFAFDEGRRSGRVVLRSAWETGRRFELARLIGDRVLWGSDEPLHPATHAFTYRQKAQRAFAVELLAPFSAVDEMLNGDYSVEQQEKAAANFNVSVMAIDRMLRNNGRIANDIYDQEVELSVA